jgi:hypothetical protein
MHFQVDLDGAIHEQDEDGGFWKMHTARLERWVKKTGERGAQFA